MFSWRWFFLLIAWKFAGIHWKTKTCSWHVKFVLEEKRERWVLFFQIFYCQYFILNSHFQDTCEGDRWDSNCDHITSKYIFLNFLADVRFNLHMMTPIVCTMSLVWLLSELTAVARKHPQFTRKWSTISTGSNKLFGRSNKGCFNQHITRKGKR